MMQHYTKLNQVLDDVTLELGRQTNKNLQYPNDPLHAIANLQASLGELSQAVLQKTYEPEKVSRAEITNKSLELSAQVIRFLLSVEEYNYRESETHLSPALDSAL